MKKAQVDHLVYRARIFTNPKEQKRSYSDQF